MAEEYPMKKILTLLIPVLFISSAALAHPPKSIDMTVNGKDISIVVTHEVEDTAKHYIKEIQVSVNGKDMIVQKFILQQNSKTEKAVYFIPSLKKEDKVEIEAECNIYGRMKKKFTVS
jgi:desulfoferrodoxin (superoxide reductase-like protein)